MAVSPTFKQQCPSCEAMISIKEGMIGKKVECTKCKDKFIAERPEEEDEDEKPSAKKDTKVGGKKNASTAVSGKAPAPGKKPAVDEDEEDEDQGKSSKADTNGKSKSKTPAKDDEEGEADSAQEDTNKPKKDKTAAGKFGGLPVYLTSAKGLLGLAVVGVAILAIAAYFVMSGGTPSPKKPPVFGKGGGVPGGPQDPTANEKKPPIVEPTPGGPVASSLTDTEAARLTNLLPNDTDHVFHVFFKDAFSKESPLHAFLMPGALDSAAFAPQLGFSMLAIDDMIVAEKFASPKAPAWKYTVIHFSEIIQEDKLKAALQLEATKIGGETCYKTTKGKTNPYFDRLARFSFGVPNELRSYEARRNGETYFRIHNPQTLIIGDEVPVTALLAAKGQFPKIDPKDSKVDPKAGARDDTYTTIKRSLKDILDRMESSGAAGKSKVLFSSATDMEANQVPAKPPDTVARQPRQFWDVSTMLNEGQPRLRALGTVLVQKDKDALKFQLRNRLTCALDGDAQKFHDELIEITSPKITRNIQSATGHKVQLPTPHKKDAPPPDDKKEPTTSQITVNQDANSVEFVLDLVLDGPANIQAKAIAERHAQALRIDVEAAMNPSLRHALANGGRLLGQKGQFPPGALSRATTSLFSDQEPKNRLSWMANLLPHMGHGKLFNKIQVGQSWRDPGNWTAGHTVVPEFLDPMYPDYTRYVAVGDLPFDFAATHYVGIAGVGGNAASYQRDDPATKHKIGVLGYDKSASLKEVDAGRGQSNIILMIQIPYVDSDGNPDVNPWIAGGGATLRGVPEKNSLAPFVQKQTVNQQNKRGTYAVMTDGSVRFINENVKDDVFKAMCTIHGPAPKDFDLAKDPNTLLIPPPPAKAKEEPKKEPPPIEKKPEEKKSEEKQPEKKTADTRFVVPGRFSIDSPAGYQWALAKELKLEHWVGTVQKQDLRKVPIAAKEYACTSATSKTRMVLIVEEHTVTVDEEKLGVIVRHFSVMQSTFLDQGHRVAAEKLPRDKAPVPVREEYMFKGFAKDGGVAVVFGQTIFGRSVYSFYVFADSQNEADRLVKVLASLKE